MDKPWHTCPVEDVFQHFGVSPDLGLSSDEAERRAQQFGRNALIETNARSPWLILWDQFTAVMVIVLIVASVISALIGEVEDTVAILAIVVLNALLGFRQEYKAERAMAALRALAAPTVTVRRDGRVQRLSARELVPGDVIFLEAGGLVPADARITECVRLRTLEAPLTGESEPVEKTAAPVQDEGVPTGDRYSMVYMGTQIVYGRGQAVVTATGMRTELGGIASLMQSVGYEPTPLQKRLDHLGRRLALAALGLVAVIFTLALFRGEPLQQVFLMAVSLAVAAVPEGLPAVVTIALALGAQRMLRRHALIRRLPAVETLGSVSVICSDKTGTLTENRMRVAVLEWAGRRMETPGSEGTTDIGPEADLSLVLLLTGGALCNDSLVEQDAVAVEGWRAVGDPTENAMALIAAQYGLFKPELEERLPRVAEVAFDSVRKRMTTIHRMGHFPVIHDQRKASGLPSYPSWLERGAYIQFTKGAVDSLLTVSTSILVNGVVTPLDDAWLRRISQANDALSQRGMRVLGVAFRSHEMFVENADVGQDMEQHLIMVGMMGLIDPLRAEVKQAVATCRSAGIRPVMITGDHPLTALAIARDLGLDSDNAFMTGKDLERLNAEDFERSADHVSVYARVSPEHKLRIVTALQTKQYTVAMTGDGINDAPALKKADIGVAMGISGTDVAKEAADMVLQDDNFATIVAAVEEGRIIYDNIRKFILYLLMCNSGELWVMLLGPFLGMPLPLIPVQILWMNLVTDGLPALALGVEPAERDVMKRPPARGHERLIDRSGVIDILWVGLLTALVTLILGLWAWRQDNPAWQTLVFTVLTLSQMGIALAVRSTRHSLFTIGLFSNRPFVGAIALTCLLQLGVIYLPFLQGVLETVPLSLYELALCVLMSAVPFIALEVWKWIKRRSGNGAV